MSGVGNSLRERVSIHPPPIHPPLLLLSFAVAWVVAPGGGEAVDSALCSSAVRSRPLDELVGEPWRDDGCTDPRECLRFFFSTSRPTSPYTL